jgi:DNA mismatch endonuclease, patch repair protein
MLGNKRVDTRPEKALRGALHAAGYRFRKDHRLDLGRVKARPDIAFTRVRLAVFVDGCYWHCCPEHGSQPMANADYWTPKLARNVERDREHDQALWQAGWTVVRLWEHVPLHEAVATIKAAYLSSEAERSVRHRHDGSALNASENPQGAVNHVAE